MVDTAMAERLAGYFVGGISPFGAKQYLPVLKEYENQGLHILVCDTCLTHFDLLDQKQVGETTNMLDIVTAMQLADKVINI